MSSSFTVRSGSLKREGVDALFATPRAISGGLFQEALLEPGAGPSRSSEEAEVRPGDVLVVLRGNANLAACMERCVSRRVFATLDLAVLRPGEGLHGRYLAWVINLKASQAALESERVSGGVPRLPLSALIMLPVPLPPLEVQRRVAEVAALGKREEDLALRLATLRRSQLDASLESLNQQHTQ